MEGARGSFLEDVARPARRRDRRRPTRRTCRSTIARSHLVSAPTWRTPSTRRRASATSRRHAPVLGGGPVLKLNANQSYATDARSGSWFAARCADAGVPVQHFVTRADLPCGSTIGPLTAMRLGLSTVDVGVADARHALVPRARPPRPTCRSWWRR